MPPQTRPVFQARSSASEYPRSVDAPPAEDVAAGQDRVGFHAAAAERALRPLAFVVCHDQLGADHLRRTALRADDGGDSKPAAGV